MSWPIWTACVCVCVRVSDTRTCVFPLCQLILSTEAAETHSCGHPYRLWLPVAENNVQWWEGRKKKTGVKETVTDYKSRRGLVLGHFHNSQLPNATVPADKRMTLKADQSDSVAWYLAGQSTMCSTTDGRILLWAQKQYYTDTKRFPSARGLPAFCRNTTEHT